MTRISRKELIEDRAERQLLDLLFSSLASLGNWQEAEAFFGEFLTHEEMVMLAKRMELYKRVNEGQKYKKIIEELGVTSQTVCDARKKLRRADVYFLRILRKFMYYDKKQKENK
jgi:uncharacterized protein YerC